MLLIYGLVSRALQVRQLLLHFLISGGAFGAGRGLQRRLSSRSILCVIFESSNLAWVSCFFFCIVCFVCQCFLSIREFDPSNASMISCLYPLFFMFSTCFSLYIWNVASFDFV